ncbi:MAG: hypothetical protein INR68_11905 [Methylobacterium mesophilicum]|nr:hypothetical protein [Methylobacterium mesophilicum]
MPSLKSRRCEVATGFRWSFAYHHRWLVAHKLIDRPWFILASAPQPTVPAALPPDVVHAYVRLAGRSAKLQGLPDGDLTILNEAGLQEAREAGVASGHLLLIRRDLCFRSKLARWAMIGGTRHLDLRRKDRDSYTIGVAGSLFSDGTPYSRPSTTIPMICFALAHKVPQIIVAGLSLDHTGHAYDRLERPRRHVREDRLALQRIADHYPQVVTTEQSLHEHTGIPLYGG